MNNINNSKILIGSTLKSIKKAKKEGYLDLKKIALYNIISNLREECDMDYSISFINHIDKILRKLQNKYPEICNYRETNKTYLFNTPDTNKNINTIGEVNNKPTVSQDECLSYFNILYSFIKEDFTQNYSDSNNDTAKYLRIITLPSDGELLYNNIPVVINQIILLEDISNLTFYYNNPFELELSTSFDYQVGDSNKYTKFSETDTFNICGEAVSNTAPTITNLDYVFDENLCLEFNQEDFESVFTDESNHLPDNIKFTNLISSIPNIVVSPNNWNPLFTFEDLIFPIEDSSSKSICIPEAPSETSWKIVDDKLVQYNVPDIEQELIDCANDNYIVDNIDDDFNYNLSRTTVTQITNNANIYAFFDTTSMQEEDGLAAKIALQSWFDNYSLENPNYEGNLYIITAGQESWVRYGIVPITGQIAFLESSGEWGNIQELPPNLNTPQWEQDVNAIVIGFVDESHNAYHAPNVSDGFNSPTQPTSFYLDDYDDFLNIYPNYEYFRGLIYPVVQDLEGNGGALVLQVMAAIEGEVLTQETIDSYNTLVDVSELLTTNPYSGLDALKDYNWGAVLDKVSPASSVFTPEIFSLDLDAFLEGSTETTVDTKTIEALNNYEKVIINFEISDNHPVDPLYSNSAAITITFSQENQLPTFGDGEITIDTETTTVFTREQFTSELDPKYFDPDGDPAYYLEILSLPQEGLLTLDEPVSVNDKILFTDIIKGDFKYIPETDSNLTEVSFTFNIIDEGSIDE